VKLLLYSHFFAPSVGGIETIVLALARGLAECRDADGAPKFEITLATQTPAGNFDSTTLPFHVTRRPGLIPLWRLIRRSDVVHLAGPSLVPLLLGLLARKPMVVEHHGFQTICPNGQLLIEPAGAPCPGHFMAGRHLECMRCNSGQGWFTSGKLFLLTFVRRFLCVHAAANITPTQWLGRLLRLPRVEAIPHGLDFPMASSRPTAPPGLPVFAFVGRLVTTKGVRVLIEAARILRAQNRAFELLIIGDGPERASLEEFARNLQLEEQVHFLGRLVSEQLEATLSRATAVVVPSVAGEVFGLVIAENMARGLPVVASDLGAFTEVLGDAGLLFCAGNAADLAAALSRVIDDPLFAASLGQRARQRAIDFCNRSRMIAAHARLYFGVQSAGKT
jgi:glycosyltransferase involved in cell wall biosynthesis